jgi:hypothetical protein
MLRRLGPDPCGRTRAAGNQAPGQSECDRATPNHIATCTAHRGTSPRSEPTAAPRGLAVPGWTARSRPFSKSLDHLGRVIGRDRFQVRAPAADRSKIGLGQKTPRALNHQVVALNSEGGSPGPRAPRRAQCFQRYREARVGSTGRRRRSVITAMLRIGCKVARHPRLGIRRRTCTRVASNPRPLRRFAPAASGKVYRRIPQVYGQISATIQ